MKTTICTAVAGLALMLLSETAYAGGPVVLADEQLDTVVAGINLHRLEDRIEAAIIQALGPQLGPIADKIEDAITFRVNI